MAGKKQLVDNRNPVFAFRLPEDLVVALDLVASRAGRYASRNQVVRAFLEAGIAANGISEEEICTHKAARQAKLSGGTPDLSLIVIPGHPEGETKKPARKRAPQKTKRRVRDSWPTPPCPPTASENRTLSRTETSGNRMRAITPPDTSVRRTRHNSAA